MNLVKKVSYYTMLVIVIILLIVMMVAVVQSVFSNVDIDTTSLTNIGFVMLLAFGNVCFSWSRTIDPVNQTKILRINKAGLECLVASILFLIGSLCKYTLLHKVALLDGDKDSWHLMNTTLFTLLTKILLSLSFLYAIGLTLGVFIVILNYYLREDR